MATATWLRLSMAPTVCSVVLDHFGSFYVFAYLQSGFYFPAVRGFGLDLKSYGGHFPLSVPCDSPFWYDEGRTLFFRGPWICSLLFR